MPQPTKQDQAINSALTLVDLADQIQSLMHQARDISARFTANDYLTVLDALPTAAWAADGTIGAADESPNVQHPITAQGLYLPSNDVRGGVYLINDFVAFMTSGSVNASDRVAAVAKLVR